MKRFISVLALSLVATSAFANGSDHECVANGSQASACNDVDQTINNQVYNNQEYNQATGGAASAVAAGGSTGPITNTNAAQGGAGGAGGTGGVGLGGASNATGGSSGVVGSGNSANTNVLGGATGGNSTSSNTGLSNNKLEGGDASASVGGVGNVSGLGNSSFSPTSSSDSEATIERGAVDNDVNTFNTVKTDVDTTDLNSNLQGQQQGQIGINKSDVDVDSRDSNYNTDVNVVEGDKNTNLQGQNTQVEGNDVNVTIGNGEQPLSASSQSSESVQTVEGDVDESVVSTQVDARDQSVTTYEAPLIPVNTAATSFSSICTSGAGRQTNTYGISLAVTSDTCTHLMMADAWMALGNQEEAIKHVVAAGRHAKFKGWFGYARHAITLGVL